MRLRCPHCDAQIDVDDAKANRRKFLQVLCWMCGRSSLHDVEKPDPNSSTIVAEPLAPQERPLAAARTDDTSTPQTASLDLPSDKIITVSVLAGPSLGMERPLTQPLLTIGRLGGGADFEIDDLQVSRLHCAVEVKGDAVFLRDLRSTNGTYVSEKRILSARLEHASEFRVGTSIVRLSIQSS